MSLKVAFIGSGKVNFGGTTDPWDHASRLEILSSEIPLEVVGISDLVITQAQNKLEQRLQKDRPHQKKKIWEKTRVFKDYREMLKTTKPNVVFVGVPPNSHGDIELSCAEYGAHMLIEKPISCQPSSEVCQLRDTLKKKYPKLIISVAYMMRYSAGVEFIKKTLETKKLSPIAILLRYNSAYESILSPFWWDSRLSGGPIIEQATHFCDLARYLGGDVQINSINVVGVEANEKIGKLSRIHVTCQAVENNIPEEAKISRSIMANWKFKSGAVGSLSYGCLLHGTKFHTECEIWCDGLKIILRDPYTEKCNVEIYDGCTTEIFNFPKDDMYLSEDRAFLEAVLKSDPSKIRSSYEDATSTYIFTEAITNLSKKGKSKL